MSVVNTLTLSPANNQLQVQGNSFGNVVIVNSIPVYTGSSTGGVERVNVTPVNSDHPVFGFSTTYSNLNTPGIALADNSGLSKTTTNDGQGNDVYVLSANVKSLTTTNGTGTTSGLTITQAPLPAEPGNFLIQSNIKGFTGPASGSPGNPPYGITFSNPNSAGIVTVTPTVCGVTAGVGIAVANVNSLQPNTLQVRATVADIIEGNGISVLDDPLTGRYQVSATVGDILPGDGIFITYGQGGTYELGVNFDQPTLSGIQQQINDEGNFELDATYQNLTTSFGLTINRDPGDTVTPPSANLVANVASLAATGTGIATSQNQSSNEWTINNTGILDVQAGQNITVDVTDGVATINYSPSAVFSEELVLSGSLQVPTIIGGKTQGTHFTQYGLNIPFWGPVYNIQPSPTQQGDCLISYGNSTFGYISNVRNGVVVSTVTQQSGIQDFVYMSTNQQSTLSPLGAGFVTSFTFMKPVNGGTGLFRTAGVICEGDAFGPRTFWTNFSNPNPLAATGIATSGINMYSLITTPGFGIYIAPPPTTGGGPAENQNGCFPLVTTGVYGNPVITRQYNKVNDNITNAARARCFCTQENGGLVEIPFSVGSPYFGAPVTVTNSPIGTGWLPLTVVPLEDQWITPLGAIPTTKFNYLIYLSNDVSSSVYNTLTEQWQTLPVTGYVSSFYNSNVLSVASPGDTIYSQFYGGSFMRSDLSPDVQGNFPNFGARSQTSSLFFPIPLNYNDCNMFASFVSVAPQSATLFQTTFTPDFSEYVGNSIQIKALDFLQLQTDGDCQVNSASLELTNETMTVNSNIIDFVTDSVSIDTGSLDLQSGVSLNANGPVNIINAPLNITTSTTTLSAVTMTADSASTVDFSNAALEIQPTTLRRNYNFINTQVPSYIIKVPIVQAWSKLLTDSSFGNVIVPGQWTQIYVVPPYLTNGGGNLGAYLGSLSITLGTSQGPSTPGPTVQSGTIQYNVLYDLSSDQGYYYVNILYTAGINMFTPRLFFTLVQNTETLTP
jgi:hypothetical protein